MTIVVFGATGRLGALVIESLRQRGVDAAGIRAVGRNEERLGEYASRGLQTAKADLSDSSAVNAAVAGAAKVLLISGNEIGHRVPQHRNVVDAAARNGVLQLVYTSVLAAPTTPLRVAGEHKATEEAIAASGVPATFLRNGWYTENYRGDFDQARETGTVANSVGEGRIATAPRSDYAEAAAVVLTEDGHTGKSYELAGDVAWSFADFAAAASGVLGTAVSYTPLTEEQERERLLAAGLPESRAAAVVGLNADIRNGLLDERSGSLSRLIGHPTVPLAETMQNWS